MSGRLKDKVSQLVEINWQPSDRQLRQFGLFAFLALPIIAWLWSRDTSYTAIAAIAGAVAAVLAMTVPQALKFVFLGLSLLTFPIGLVVSELIVMLIFFGVFLPIGLFFRITGRDNLQLNRDRGGVTYWRPKSPPKGVASYYRQS